MHGAYSGWMIPKRMWISARANRQMAVCRSKNEASAGQERVTYGGSHSETVEQPPRSSTAS